MRQYVKRQNDSLKEPKEIKYTCSNEDNDISNIILIIKGSIEKFKPEQKTEKMFIPRC